MNLIEFCVALALDPVLFARYLVNPEGLAVELGLPAELYAILASGDRVLIAQELARESRFPTFWPITNTHTGVSDLL